MDRARLLPSSSVIAARCAGLLILAVALSDACCQAANPPEAKYATGVPTAPGEGFTCLGKVRPRHARDIESSNWSVGAETMDRDYTVYANWRNYLGPLGAKQARIQSGWAKTEREPGKYDWGWLDEIIPDMVAQGVKPWICVCYGNPIYEGGGGTGLSGGLPESPKALAAWDAYVAALVDRYQQHVDQWEIWNEPRTGRGKGAEAYAEFAARTVAVVRGRQPKARIMLAAGGAFDIPFVEQMLAWLRDRDQLSLCNEVVYHPYSYNPDDSYARVNELRKVVASFSPEIIIRQDENGVPSRANSFGAVSGYNWSELRQAKWATRRLLGDLGRDIPSSYFSICDMAYLVRQGTRGDSDLRDEKGNLEVLLNSKGLLEINNDRTIHHAKQAYRAVQHITALFDGRVKRITDFEASVAGGSEGSKHSVFGYRAADGGLLVTVWRSSDIPGVRPGLEELSLTVTKGSFQDPVWVDLLSGDVYDIADGLWKAAGEGCTFLRVPVYDAVVVVAERSSIGELLPSD
ncbi:MAG: hypothetical protein ACYC6Y_11950 [Thermoguttaceae bacterium]